MSSFGRRGFIAPWALGFGSTMALIGIAFSIVSYLDEK